MTPFEALAHALTTVSTAGFSTSDASMARWDNAALHWIATVFMLSGAIPFVLYLRLFQGQRDALRDSQVWFLVGLLAVVIVAVAAGWSLAGRHGAADALRLAAFNVVSVVTTTGYATADYMLWGNLMIGLFFGLDVRRRLHRVDLGRDEDLPLSGDDARAPEPVPASALPTGRLPPRLCRPAAAGRGDRIGGGVLLAVLHLLQRAHGRADGVRPRLPDQRQCRCGQRCRMSGRAWGRSSVPPGNFATLPDAAKWLLCFGMLLGRLELFTVLILFFPQFWRG